MRGLTLIFLELWGATQKAAPEVERYLPDVPYTARENAVVLPYADNPLDDEATGENVYLNMIRSAKDYVYITTPYLILSDEMQRTLRLAASSGVDVRIITPRKTFHFVKEKYGYQNYGGVCHIIPNAACAQAHAAFQRCRRFCTMKNQHPFLGFDVDQLVEHDVRIFCFPRFPL